MNKGLLSLAVAWGLLASNQWVAQEVWRKPRENQKLAIEAVVDSTKESLVDTIHFHDAAQLLEEIMLSLWNLDWQIDELWMDVIQWYLEESGEIREILFKMVNREDVMKALREWDREKIVSFFEREILIGGETFADGTSIAISSFIVVVTLFLGYLIGSKSKKS